MKVLLVHESFPPTFRGGGELILLKTAHLLREMGIDVRVLTSGDPAVTEYEGIPTRRLRGGRYRMNVATREVAAAATEVDLVQTTNYHAARAALRGGRSAGVPVVCLVLGLFQASWRGLKGPIIGPLFQAWEGRLLRLPYDRIVFISEFSRRAGETLGVDPSRSRTVIPGIDLELWGPARDKEKTVLFVGKLERRKGVQEVLEVARRLPHIPFRMVGWGKEEERIRSLAPANLELVPFQRGESLRDEFARARMFLFPSHAETLGLVLVEAMASACPVVSTIPLEFAGAHVETGDVEAMAEAVERIWSSPELREEMGERNLELAGRYRWDLYASGLLDVYGEILPGRVTERDRTPGSPGPGVDELRERGDPDAE